ncbi:uncharacterized protein, partial [Trachinotus anak]|uniref:uncharacterized protein n=1 Tax=Trachinotus anak TaxID=443729 RepID=UPI0039F1D9F4
THTQYVDLMRTLLMQYPFLREKCGSGYDALLESLHNKFKKERIPLISNSEVAKMRKRFSLPNGGRKLRAESEGSESSVKKLRAILEEMKLVTKVDVDKQGVVNLTKMSKNILDKAPKSDLKDKSVAALDASKTEEERRGQIVNAAVLLLPSIFKEDPQQLFVIDKISQNPVYATPTIVLRDVRNECPLQSSAITVKMDDTEMILDGGSVDISPALAVAFSLYHVIQVEYPRNLRKTVSFLEAFVFKIKDHAPIAVQRFYNSL